MRPGRPKWTTRLSAGELERVHAAIDAGADSAAALYDRFNVARTGTHKKTFALYVSRRRRDRAERRAADHADAAAGGDGRAPTPQSLLAQSLSSLEEALAARTLKSYALPAVIRSLVNLHELRISEQAEQRAAELHETKMADVRARQNAAVDELAAGGRLTPEIVAEIRTKVLGL